MDGWLLYAWIVPVAWGIATLIDVLMIEWKIYQDATQATSISGLVMAMPLLLVVTPIANLEDLDITSVVVGLCSGLCYALFLSYFYKALFTANDGAHTEAFMNTEVVIVPVLAFLILGESLNTTSYLSIVFAGLGVLVLNWESRGMVAKQRRLTRLLAVAVLVSSVGFIFQDILFDLTSYRAALVCYALGVLIGVTPALLQRGLGKTCHRLIKYCRLVFISELFAVIATLASMRAIALAPSVSLVAVIETVRPLVIMLVCTLAWITMHQYSIGSVGTRHALREQFSGSVRKLIACLLIGLGVFFASLQ